jgi:predicted helicase
MTPNSWLDGNAQDGMRIMFEKEFSSIYILDLKGNGRTSGERCRQEGEPLFAAHGGQGGTLLGACATIFVKNPNSKTFITT